MDKIEFRCMDGLISGTACSEPWATRWRDMVVITSSTGSMSSRTCQTTATTLSHLLRMMFHLTSTVSNTSMYCVYFCNKVNLMITLWSEILITWILLLTVSNLRKLGTYAGNDAIVAFARLHHVNVLIHQLSAPFLLVRSNLLSLFTMLDLAAAGRKGPVSQSPSQSPRTNVTSIFSV